jgi:hypothetical protein
MRRRCAILTILSTKKKKHLINERSRVTRRDTADTAHRYVIVVKTCRATQNRSVSAAANVAISARAHGATSISRIREEKEKGKKAAAHFRRVASRMIGVSLFIPNSTTCYPTNWRTLVKYRQTQRRKARENVNWLLLNEIFKALLQFTETRLEFRHEFELL